MRIRVEIYTLSDVLVIRRTWYLFGFIPIYSEERAR